MKCCLRWVHSQRCDTHIQADDRKYSPILRKNVSKSSLISKTETRRQRKKFRCYMSWKSIDSPTSRLISNKPTALKQSVEPLLSYLSSIMSARWHDGRFWSISIFMNWRHFPCRHALSWGRHLPCVIMHTQLIMHQQDILPTIISCSEAVDCILTITCLSIKRTSRNTRIVKRGPQTEKDSLK